MDATVLKKLQKTEHEILQRVVKICDENSLTYFLIGGTLLGAIRHKGFIPWDDDLDIAMPRKDYEKFLSVGKTQLGDKYWIHCNETDSDYWLPFAKVRKKDTVFEEKNSINIVADKGIFIDIFPLDNASKESSLFQTVQAKLLKKLSTVILWRRGFYITKPKVLLSLVIGISKIKTVSDLINYQQKIMKLNRSNKSRYFVNLGSNYNYVKQTIPKNKYYPPVKVEFDGEYYNAPNDWDYVLSRIYGDYMKLPPEEKRVTHDPARIKFVNTEEIKF